MTVYSYISNVPSAGDSPRPPLRGNRRGRPVPNGRRQMPWETASRTSRSLTISKWRRTRCFDVCKLVFFFSFSTYHAHIRLFDGRMGNTGSKWDVVPTTLRIGSRTLKALRPWRLQSRILHPGRDQSSDENTFFIFLMLVVTRVLNNNNHRDEFSSVKYSPVKHVGGWVCVCVCVRRPRASVL